MTEPESTTLIVRKDESGTSTCGSCGLKACVEGRIVCPTLPSEHLSPRDRADQHRAIQAEQPPRV